MPSAEPKKRGSGRGWLVALLIVGGVVAAANAQNASSGGDTSPSPTVGQGPSPTLAPTPTIPRQTPEQTEPTTATTIRDCTEMPGNFSNCPPPPPVEFLVGKEGAWNAVLADNDEFWGVAFPQITGGAAWWPVEDTRIRYLCPDDGEPLPPGFPQRDCGASSNVSVYAAGATVNFPAAPALGETAGRDYIGLDAGAVLDNWDQYFFGTAIYVLAHEYAHAVQWRMGIPHQVPEKLPREVQADCFAGAAMGGRATTSTAEWAAFILSQGTDLFESVGASPEDELRTHGSAEERAEAFGLGFRNGPATCVDAYTPTWDVNIAFPRTRITFVQTLSGTASTIDGRTGTTFRADVFVTAEHEGPLEVFAYGYLPDGTPAPAAGPPGFETTAGDVATSVSLDASFGVGTYTVTVHIPWEELPGDGEYYVLFQVRDAFNDVITAFESEAFFAG